MAQHDADADTERGREPRQLLLVAACVVAVLFAAVATPTAAGGTDVSGPEIGIVEYVLEQLQKLFGGDGSGEFPPEEGCAVAPLSEPTPGADLTVRVWQDGDPAPDSRVWFNGEFVGRTDDNGLVTGQVPYEETLQVRVDVPGGGACQFGDAEDLADLGDPGDLTDLGPAGELSVPAGQPLLDSDGHRLPVTASMGPGTEWHAQETPDDEGNYSVSGRTRIRLRGQPVPGGTVEVVAFVETAPMRNATVLVDGETVGRTDDSGRYRLSIPTDADTVRVEVSRGDFAATRTVQVQRLSVALRSDGGLVVLPGDAVTVVATRGPSPVAGANVTLDGEPVGTTDTNGSATVTVPADPTATVVVREGGETARAGVWLVYAGSGAVVGLLALVVVVSVGLGYLARGVRGVGYALAFWLAVGATAAATVRWGTDGLVASVVTIAVLSVGWALVRHRTTVAGGSATLGERVRSAVDWLLDRILHLSVELSDVIGRVGDWFGGLRGWLGDLRGRLGDVAAWLRSLDVRAMLRSRRTHVALAALVLFVAAVVAVETWGVPGLLVVVLVGFLLAIAATIRLRTESEPTDRATADDRADAEPTPSGEADDRSVAWLRRVWRRFASRVAPGRWRTRTPDEVSRAAVDRGLPPEPVERLTEVFREVEYGGREFSEAQRELASDAADRLESALGTDGNGGDDE